MINITDKILIIAPHPDDEVIGCGGIMAKYSAQTDVMVLNSSGFQVPYEECADIRISEFNKVMKFFGISQYWIWKIFGQAPNFDEMNALEKDYLAAVDFRKYDYIFAPDINDEHAEHQFVARDLVPRLLSAGGYSEKTMICFYNVWGAQEKTNYIEDISDVYSQKELAIKLYASRNQEVLSRLIKHNRKRKFLRTKYVESFYCEKITNYLKRK